MTDEEAKKHLAEIRQQAKKQYSREWGRAHPDRIAEYQRRYRDRKISEWYAELRAMGVDYRGRFTYHSLRKAVEAARKKD